MDVRHFGYDCGVFIWILLCGFQKCLWLHGFADRVVMHLEYDCRALWRCLWGFVDMAERFLALPVCRGGRLLGNGWRPFWM